MTSYKVEDESMYSYIRFPLMNRQVLHTGFGNYIKTHMQNNMAMKTSCHNGNGKWIFKMSNRVVGKGGYGQRRTWTQTRTRTRTF